jgi:general secretion pathway protein I
VRKPNGFTLLEVLIATVIMAIAVTGLLSALSTSISNAGRLTDYDRALLMARQKMDEVLLDKKLAEGLPIRGTWDAGVTGGEAMEWRAVVTPFDKPEPSGTGTPILERVELQIAWTRGGAPRTFTLEGFRRNYQRESAR